MALEHNLQSLINFREEKNGVGTEKASIQEKIESSKVPISELKSDRDVLKEKNRTKTEKIKNCEVGSTSGSKIFLELERLNKKEINWRKKLLQHKQA